jgi:ABC-type nitrate/sulfonate/bicarbonate transport system substrate-binding protein
MIGRRTFLTGAAALAATRSAYAADAVSVNVGAVLEDDSCAVLYGAQSGIFARHGLAPTIERMTNGNTAIAATIGGSLQFAKSSCIALVAAHVKGVPLVVIAPSAISTPQNPVSGLLVPANSSLKTGRDFNGKTFGVGSLVDSRVLAIKAWVDTNGGDAKTLKFVEIPGSEIVQALSSQRIDATVASAPILEAALATGQVKQIADPNLAVASRFVLTTWFTTSDYAKQNPDIVRGFCAGLKTSAVYANAHPVEMASYLAPFSGIPLDVLQKAKRSDIGVELVSSEYQPVIDCAARYGFIEKAFPARDLVLSV